MGEGKGKKDEGQKKEKSSEEEKNGITVVLKTEMHCEGCATKILKCVKTIEGVGKAKAEWEANRLTVRGEVDPSELREELQERLRKKVDLISPLMPKKSDKEGNAVGNNKKADSKKDDGKKDDGKKEDGKKKDDKKPKEKEAPVRTAVLKLRLHCTGCIVKIHKLASKTEGVKSISIDKEKELVTVTGTMDVNALAESLEEKMKRSVAIVPEKKDKDGGGGGNKDGGGGGNKDGSGGGGDGKKNKKNDGDEAGGGMFEGNRMEYVGVPSPSYGPMYGHGQGQGQGQVQGLGPGYGYPYPYANPYTYGNNLHAPQMFSDENPNACSVM